MKHIYIQALILLDQHIKDCGKAIRDSQDEFSLLYWRTELETAQRMHVKILQRSRINCNVVRVDFINKRKVA